MAGPGGQEVGRVSVRVVPNTENFRRELKAQLEKETAGLEAEVDLKPDTGGFREKVRAATSNLPDAKVHVDVEVSKFDRLKKSVGGFFDNLDTGGGGGAGKFMAPFIDNMVLIAGVAAIAAPAIALATGALTALPAVLAGVLVPIGAVTLGMEGIANAAKVLSEPVTKLKASLSKTFEDRFTPIFDKLAGVIPRLDGPLNVVANGIANVAKSIVDMVVNGEGMSLIEGTINNIGKAISDSAPGLTDLTNGLLGLAEGVSRKFPAVATWLNKVGDSFSTWVDKVTADGSLDRAMGNFGDTLKGVLDIVGDIAEQGFEWLQDPEFGKAMTDFVANTKTLVNEILPGLGGMFTQITGALNGIVPVLEAIDKWKPPDWMGLGGDKAKQVPGFGGFPGMGPAENPLGPRILEETTTSFQNTMMVLKDVWNATWMTMAANAAQTIGQISFNLSTIWANVQTAAAGAWNGIIAIVSGVVGQIISTVAQVPGRIAGAWAGIPGVAAGIFAQVVSTIASAGAQMLAEIVSAGAQIVAEVATWGGKVAAAAQSIATSLVGIGAQMIAGFLSGFEGAAANALSVVAGWAGKIGAAARSALGINSPSKVFADIGSGVVEGFNDGLDGGAGSAIERAKSLAQQISEAFDSGMTMDSSMSDQIKRSLDELELQRKQLKVDKNAIPKEDKEGRAAVQNQMDEIQALKDQLSLQKEQLGFGSKYADSTDSVTEANNIITEQIAGMIDLAKGFFNATSGQFMSDLGMSGEGAIPKVAGMGLDWATGLLANTLSEPFGGGKGGAKTEIHVNSVDEALAAKQNLTNKEALRYRQR